LPQSLLHSALKTQTIWTVRPLLSSFCLRALSLDLDRLLGWLGLISVALVCALARAFCHRSAHGEIPGALFSFFSPLNTGRQRRDCAKLYTYVKMYEHEEAQICAIPVSRLYRGALFIPLPLSPISIHFYTFPIPIWRWCLLHARRVAATTCDRHQRLFFFAGSHDIRVKVRDPCVVSLLMSRWFVEWMTSRISPRTRLSIEYSTPCDQ
jgi:hypothetical protein